MLSAPGSNIASGIERALDTFPPQSARNSFIVVFTDGDETEGNIARSVLRASSFGVHVFLVGTGTDTETEILAGDGKTPVKSGVEQLVGAVGHGQHGGELADDQVGPPATGPVAALGAVVAHPGAHAHQAGRLQAKIRLN